MQVTLRLTGLLASLVLTFAAYFLITQPEWFGVKNPTAVRIIFILAGLQAVFQLVCFIHVWKEKGPLWNLYVFLSTVVIVFVVIFFSIWIMSHLNENMMVRP